MSWTSSGVVIGTTNYIAMFGSGNTVINSNLRQVGSTIQIATTSYISNTTGLIRVNFNSGTNIELSTDGGALISPNVIIDSNKISLTSSFGSMLLNTSNIALTHSNITLYSNLLTVNSTNFNTSQTETSINSNLLVSNTITTAIAASNSLILDSRNVVTHNVNIQGTNSTSFTYSGLAVNPSVGYTLASTVNGMLQIVATTSIKTYTLDSSNLNSARTYNMPDSNGEIVLKDYVQVLTNKTILSTASNIVDATRLQTITISTTAPTKVANSTMETLSGLVYDGTNWIPNKFVHYQKVPAISGSGTFVTTITHSMVGAFVGFNVYQEGGGTVVSYNANNMANLQVLANTSNNSVIAFTLPKGSYTYHIILYKGFDSYQYNTGNNQN